MLAAIVLAGFFFGCYLSRWQGIYYHGERRLVFGVQLTNGLPALILAARDEMWGISKAYGRNPDEKYDSQETLYYDRMFDVGVLFTCISGLVNLLMVTEVMEIAIRRRAGGG